MNDRDLVSYCINSLLKVGADKAQVSLKNKEKYELNTEGKEFSLLRTTFSTDINLTAIKDNRKATININKSEIEAIDETINALMELIKTSEIDEANDISPYQEEKEFIKGDAEPNPDAMHKFLKDYINVVSNDFPLVTLMDSLLEFDYEVEYFENSNGVKFKTTQGLYTFSSVFASKDGEKSSSFNYTAYSTLELNKALIDSGSTRNLLKQSIEHLYAKPLEGKFTGDIIITPDCLHDLISAYTGVFLRDMSLISGTSVLKNSLNEIVANENFSLYSLPLSKEIAYGYFVTPDGFEAKDTAIIENGVLKTFLLSQYGANKTSRERAVNSGGAYVIAAGNTPFETMVKSIDKGIILSRFSGGNPSSNGDFSGVAKNSYYVENGEIKYPISETMISGNLLTIFKDIKSISSESINSGHFIFPWICSKGVTISGK